MKTQKMSTCLWYDGNAKEAATFYCSVFSDSKIISENQMVTVFELNGNNYLALNGGPMFKFNEAVSIVIHCDTQEEIDHYWDSLLKGGTAQQCGWLKDKFGLSWQIVPSKLAKMMNHPDPVKAKQLMETMMQMVKFDIAKLEAVYNN